MQFNGLESLFFDRILQAELDVPINAVLSVGGETIEMVIVPKIDGRGRFILDTHRRFLRNMGFENMRAPPRCSEGILCLSERG